jgi:hypothetical protein
MKASVLPPNTEAMQKAAARKVELKQLSNEKLKHWPNTLEAIRIKKESFIKDREESDELERQEVDKREAEMKRNERLEAIRRANDLIYDQTDKMKMLKSQKLYAEVVYTRQQQEEEKKRVKEKEKVVEAHYHEIIVERVKKGEAEEAEKLALRQAETEKVKTIRSQQRDEIRQRRQDIEDANYTEGQRLKAAFAAQVAEEREQEERRQERIIAKNFENLEENKKQQKIRDEFRDAERRKLLKCDEEKEVIESRKSALKVLEKRRFDRAQETKQKMIDAAVRQLELQNQSSSALFMKQEQEIKDREDRAIADKEAKQKAQWDAIVASRTAITERKEAQYWKDVEEEKQMVAKFRRENEEGIQAELDKQQRAKDAQTAIKLQQLQEGHARRKRIEEEIAAQKEQERFLQSIGSNDDQRFKEICMKEIERNVALGKPVYTLLRALEFVAPPLLAAKLIKKQPGERKKGE